MNTKIKIEAAAPANFVKLSPNTRSEIIHLLARTRLTWRNAIEYQKKSPSERELAGIKAMAINVFHFVELATPQDELWTHLPDEKELTPESRIGDHLAVTRRLLGFIA